MSGRSAASASAPSGSPGGGAAALRKWNGTTVCEIAADEGDQGLGAPRVAGGRNRVRRSRTVVTGTAVSRAMVSLWSSSARSRCRA